MAADQSSYPQWTDYRKKSGLDPLGMQSLSRLNCRPFRTACRCNELKSHAKDIRRGYAVSAHQFRLINEIGRNPGAQDKFSRSLLISKTPV